MAYCDYTISGDTDYFSVETHLTEITKTGNSRTIRLEIGIKLSGDFHKDTTYQSWITARCPDANVNRNNVQYFWYIGGLTGYECFFDEEFTVSLDAEQPSKDNAIVTPEFYFELDTYSADPEVEEYRHHIITIENLKLYLTKEFFVYIDNETTFEPYKVHIDSGSSWDEYIPYIDNGSGWDLCMG